MEKEIEDSKSDVSERRTREYTSRIAFQLHTKEKLEDKRSKADLMSHIYVGFLINSEIDASDFI